MVTLRAAAPVRVGDITLVPVERTIIGLDKGDAGCWVSAFKEPHAVVVCDAGRVRAFGPDSSEIALDGLIEEAANLGAVLGEISIT